MKILSTIALILLTNVSLMASEVRSSTIKKVIADAIDDYADTWSTDEMGSIWIVPYSDLTDASGYTEEGEPESYSFYFTERLSNKHFVVAAHFLCGSEYDESRFGAYCDLDLIKNAQSQWQASVRSCRCGDY